MKKTLKDLRVEKAMTQIEFAAHVGVSATTLAAWEVGRKVPSFRLRRSVAAKLGMKPAQIAWTEREAAFQ